MYTECPDCESAFRVTAHVLQQGGGRVLCGRCGNEFNALERLTEDPPEGTEPVPEVKALLETLDELTGPHEIRIEDTGIEWRVIDDDEDEDYGNCEEQVPEPAGTEACAEEEPLRPVTRDHLQDSLELSGGSEVQRYDDNTPLSDEFLDEPEIPQRRAEDHIVPRSPEADEAQVDLALGEPDDWVDLLEEVAVPRAVQAAADADADAAETAPNDDADPAAADGNEEDDELADTDVRPLDQDDDALLDPDYPSDIDTQFDLQAIEMGIDLTGSREELKLEDYPELEAAAPRDDEDPGPAEDDAAAATPQPPPEVFEAELATDAAPDQEAASATASPAETAVTSADAAAMEEQEEAAPDEGAGTSSAAYADHEERLREMAFEEELEAAYSGTTDEAGPPTDERTQDDHFVPPQTAEEMTINMLIDQDLLRLAEQQEVFSSEKGRMRLEAPQVETIIMEGEFVRTALEEEALSGNAVRADAQRPGADVPGDAQAPPAAADALDDDLDTYVEGQPLRGGRRRTDPPGYAVIGGVAALALLLSVQVVHAWRDSLATYPVFERTVGAVYGLFGEPLTPDWDVKAWQFQSTSGSADDLNEVLTISSQLTNSSGKQMPYPLLHVSLTDRWEEIIGSKVLEPREYLASGADPATRVPAGGEFTALVTVQSPSPEATGFKLNVCYRETGDRVRCATQDFKN